MLSKKFLSSWFSIIRDKYFLCPSVILLYITLIKIQKFYNLFFGKCTIYLIKKKKDKIKNLCIPISLAV